MTRALLLLAIVAAGPAASDAPHLGPDLEPTLTALMHTVNEQSALGPGVRLLGVEIHPREVLVHVGLPEDDVIRTVRLGPPDSPGVTMAAPYFSVSIDAGAWRGHEGVAGLLADRIGAAVVEDPWADAGGSAEEPPREERHGKSGESGTVTLTLPVPVSRAYVLATFGALCALMALAVGVLMVTGRREPGE